MNNFREGLIPTVLGSAVTAAGFAMKQKGSNQMIANTIFGFGLAHIVLGAIDLVEHRRQYKEGHFGALLFVFNWINLKIITGYRFVRVLLVH